MAAYDELTIEALGSRPMKDGLYFTTLSIENSGPVPLAVISVVALDSTHVRVTFNQKLKNNFSLNHRDNYTFSPVLTVLTVVPEAATSPIYVDLTTSEMKQGQSYTLTVEELEAA